MNICWFRHWVFPWIRGVWEEQIQGQDADKDVLLG